MVFYNNLLYIRTQVLAGLDLGRPHRNDTYRVGRERQKTDINGLIEGVPGKKPYVTSDKLLDSPSKLPCIPL